jgi:hypothetical protein
MVLTSGTMMAQILTVCRVGTAWGIRDVTGEVYGHSTDIENCTQLLQQRNPFP